MRMVRSRSLANLASVFALSAVVAGSASLVSDVSSEPISSAGPVSGVPMVFAFAVVTAVVTTVSVGPLAVSGPWGPRTVLRGTVGRVAVATLVVALISLVVPAFPDVSTVVVTGVVLATLLTGWFVRFDRPSGGGTLVATTDPDLASRAIETLPVRPDGFVSPPLHVTPDPRVDGVDTTHERGTDADSTANRSGRRPMDGVPAPTEEDDGQHSPRSDGGRPANESDGNEDRDRDVDHDFGNSGSPHRVTIDAETEAVVETSTLDGVAAIDGVPRLGGLSRLDAIFSSHDVDAVALAIGEADRCEFFGTLELCRDHTIAALVPASLAEHVIVTEELDGGFYRVDLNPWSWYSRLGKRIFDLAFAAFGLVVLTPLILLIAAAITLDSAGPVFYEQPRTTTFGRQFRLLKFRTMVPESDDAAPLGDEQNERITRVGRLLRTTHLDEIPQLASILVGDMSVVGPRAVWTEEERLLEREVPGWRSRWLVKPGLTGLAQVRGVTSTDGHRKLEHDLEYVRDRSFLLDLRIVLAQIHTVLTDTHSLATGDDGGSS
ncbi:sugar transferase [Halovivax cerinus]|uniref:Sugar transferase n=1 Tax=Halovivax cerinus TaxID=1487865 RepID=A0ABD5NNZ9_9EURY|nr:sugar transferase [Halovivax cerinus]